MTFGKNSSIGFIGAGNVGTSLAVALHNKGYNVASVASRTFESALNFSCEIQDCNPERNIQKTVNVSEVVFVTTPDDAIEAVADEEVDPVDCVGDDPEGEEEIGGDEASPRPVIGQRVWA